MMLKGKTQSLIFWLLLTTTIVALTVWMFWLTKRGPVQVETRQVEATLNFQLKQMSESLQWLASNPGLVLLSLPPDIDVRAVFNDQDVITFNSSLIDETRASDLLANLVGFSKLPRQADSGLYYWRDRVLLLALHQRDGQYSMVGLFFDQWLNSLEADIGYQLELTASKDSMGEAGVANSLIELPSTVGKPVYLVVRSQGVDSSATFPWWVSILLSGSVAGVIIWVFYYRPVWMRLEDIMVQTNSVMQTSDFKGRVECKGHDDIAELAVQINVLLSSLEYCYRLMAKTNMITTELMYKVDSQSSRQETVYESEQSELKASLDVVSRLSAAIESEGVETYLQPVFSQDRKTITGYEALARWVDRDLGMVSATDFVSLCEKSGLTDQLTRVMLDSVLSVLKRIHSKNDPCARVSVNLSTSQFLSTGLLEYLNSLNPSEAELLGFLEFELKESTITHDFDQVEIIIQKLKDLGVGICIDDYGLGRYSLIYLQRIPVSSIKLSAAFTERLAWQSRDVAFIEGIAQFASGLGIRVIVKNIENEIQLDTLDRGLPIEYQGVSLSPPAPLSAVLA